MTRAVIELDDDIGPAMPALSQSVEGGAYNPQTQVLGFRSQGMGVVVERGCMTIYNVENEVTARTLLDWITEKCRTASSVQGI